MEKSREVKNEFISHKIHELNFLICLNSNYIKKAYLVIKPSSSPHLSRK